MSRIMKILLLFTFFFGASEYVRCAEIFAVIPSPFYSHQATFRPLWRELARRGHKITLVTTDLMEDNENITQIDYHGAYEVFARNNVMTVLKSELNIFKVMSKMLDAVEDLIRFQFTHPELVKLLESNRTFDVMMIEFTQPGWPLLSVKFKCPFVGLSTMDAHPGVHAAVGNAAHPAMYPYVDFGFGEKLTLKERIFSAGLTVLGMTWSNLIFRPMGNRYVRKYLGEGMPDITGIHKNASLMFVNANPIFFSPRPSTPITINLGGGLHLTHPKELPKDLQKYLDESKDGCIYVSFGTTVNSAYLSAEQKEVLTSVFKDMAPMRILWKFDEVDIANKPKNVEIRTWVPQQDVLRHPNVKAFITQGGLQSMEEAIDSAVPMLGMPFYGDQNNNVNKMETKKFGLKLLPTEMNKESLKAALKELLENPIYKKNIDKLSAISKDQPMKGLEKAVWWTEYVLRHGTQHLRSPSADIPLYQYYFLDVIAVVSVCAYVFYKLMKSLILTLVLILRKLYNFFIVKRKRD
ncbi:UDP-glycosyltransferase UGT4-like isoform X1 [Harmonia axyridis]|uniref:UDP-glycosyltransferase UGT4-like isoform X1 n=1 Tax=Harmonia axyridis TaxID=115357 RepID=UPI001E277830|nr:UDP-glycosyltransferase UGT4-like isoform X1 [Harmonia axyridis]